MKIVGNIMHPVATAGNDAMEAAAKATVDWNSKCAIPQTLYRVISGMPIGTMTVSMRAENWAALSAGVTPMYVDEGQIALQKELGESYGTAGIVSRQCRSYGWNNAFRTN